MALSTRARQQQLAVLVYAAPFLPERHPGVVEILRGKAAAGCQIRIALGDPNSPKLLERGAEENFGIVLTIAALSVQAGEVPRR